jgi:hypothetical protein
MKPRTRPARVPLTHLVSLGSRPTDRDRQIVLDCYGHNVLTTSQLQRLHFAGLRAAERRLHMLYQLRVLDRFRPPIRPGSGTAPYHWILDEAGAHVVVAHYGIERRELKWRHAKALALAESPKLRHHIEVNEFFAALAYEAATQRRGRLTEWYGQRSIHGLFGGLIWPDGYGVLTLRDRPPTSCLSSTAPPSPLPSYATRHCATPPRSRKAHSRLTTLSSFSRSRLTPAPAPQATRWLIREPPLPSPSGAKPPLAIVTQERKAA